MKIDNIIMAAGGNQSSGATTSVSSVGDPWWPNVSLYLNGDTTDVDPYWSNVSLMLTGDDFIDWSNSHQAVTNNGGVTVNTTTKKYGNSSLFFSGSSGTALSIPTSTTNMGTGDFTVEAWAYYTNITGWRDIICFVGSVNWGITTNNGDLGAYNIGINASGTIVPTNTWFHVAVTKQSNTVRLFLNGTIVGTATDTQNLTTTQINIGSWSAITSENLNGYIDDLRITKGVARYTANFTPPTTALPAFKIQDASANSLALTPYGNVQLSASNMKFGTGAMYFDGTGDYLTTTQDAILLATSDFTIEAWVYSIGSKITFINAANIAGQTYGIFVQASAFYVGNGTSWEGNIAIPDWSTNTWQHHAAVRSNNTFYYFINGALQGSFTAATNVSVPTGWWEFGSQTRNSFYHNGYIDDLRITKGYARYTQNFTPPSQSFATQYISTGYDPNYADVSLLLNGNGTNGGTTFTDLSSNNRTVTNNGSVTVSTSTKKYGTGSLYFNGSTSYLSIPFGYTTQDLTWECWFMKTANMAASTGIIAFHTASPASSSNFSGQIYVQSTGLIRMTFSTGTALQGTTITQNQWYHVAYTRRGTTGRLFLNGVLAASATDHTHQGTGNICMVGSNGGQYLWPGYLDDIRITIGTARYLTDFTPPTYQLPTDTTGKVIDPLRASTSLLLRGNGTNGSTSFTDESPNGLTVTNNGSVTVNTTTKKYGTGSMAFNGSNYLTVPNSSSLLFGTGDFTVEAWINLTSIPSANVSTIAGVWDASSGYGWIMQTDPTMLRIVTTGLVFTSASWAPATNIWYHIAVSRSGGSIRIFVNGTQIGTTATVTGDIQSTFTLNIGMNRDSGSSSLPFNGYVDDLRITKGYARYTANFTPPTYEDPIVTGTVLDYNYPQVSLLLNGDGTNGSTTFTDLSSRPKTITAYGNAQISTTQKKFGTGSMYFDGAGDYLTAPITEFQLGTTDFTIEAWIYSNDITTYKNICGSWVSGAYSFIFDTWANGYLHFKINSNTEMLIASTAIATGTWYHVAVSRSGSSFYMFLNGVSVATTSNSNAIVAATAPLAIGANADTAYGQNWNGYIDDLRITKGVARYTTNFTPPTAPLPTSYS